MCGSGEDGGGMGAGVKTQKYVHDSEGEGRSHRDEAAERVADRGGHGGYGGHGYSCCCHGAHGVYGAHGTADDAYST